MNRKTAFLMVAALLVAGLGIPAWAQFASAFDRTPDRPWIGPEYWTNPLQDWRIAGGALECINAGPARSVILLTRELSDRPAPFTSSIDLAPWQPAADKSSSAWVGFRLAARGRFGENGDRSHFLLEARASALAQGQPWRRGSPEGPPSKEER